MTAVGLLATIPGGGSGEGDTGGRASADSGSLFGDALTAAGRTLDGATDSGTAMPATARQSGSTAEASAVPDRTIDPQAAIAAMTHLVAWSAPVTSATTPQVQTPQATTSETTVPQVTAPQATTSETPLPGEITPDATGETMLGAAGAEATPVDPASGGTEPDAAAPVRSDTVPAAQTTTASATSTSATPASAPVSSPASALTAASAAAVADGRGEPQTLQRRPAGDVREVGIEATATSQEPASGGADPLTSDPVAAVLRPEPLARQSPPAIASLVGIPVAALAPGAGGSVEQQLVSDAGDQAQGSQPVPATAPIAPVAPGPTVTPVPSPDAAATTNRAVAAQVAPVVVSIAQRPMGTHQLTMTVNPDSLGPVTVRAHITASGEVQVELSGATDAGRDALRTMLVELRRDLAAVMPHATLSVNHGGSADSSGDRGQQAAGDAPTQQGAGDRDAHRGRPDHRRGVEQAPDLPRTIQTTPSATSGAGLDIFA